MNDDQQLKDDVLAELRWEPSVSEAHIGVTANGGVVTLLGHVDSYAEKAAAEAATRKVRGVKAVAQEIEVRLPFESVRGDDDIASAAISRLSWNCSIPRDAVKVQVEKGWVTLTGELEWRFQKVAARDEVRMLLGVLGVSDQTTVKEKADSAHISQNIKDALHRSWFDPRGIFVSAFGGTVTLSGKVGSWHDYDLASSTAWASPGTTDVNNNIAIV
jgi:osmotically-inducible protein OsmY